MTIKRKIKSNKITIDHLEEFKGKDVIITIVENPMKNLFDLAGKIDIDGPYITRQREKSKT